MLLGVGYLFGVVCGVFCVCFSDRKLNRVGLVSCDGWMLFSVCVIWLIWFGCVCF